MISPPQPFFLHALLAGSVFCLFSGRLQAAADLQIMHHGQKALIHVLENDGLPSGGTVTVSVPPASGTAVPDAQGKILYTHTTGTPASDTFTYQVTLPGGGVSQDSVTIEFSQALRIANPRLNVPSAPPPTEFRLVNAFPGVTTSSPTTIATAPGDQRRLFIGQKSGILRLIPDVTAAQPTSAVFLNLATLLTSRGESLSTSSENGLLGVAFHPGYADNGSFFVFYSVSVSGTNFQRLSGFTRNPANPNLADPASERILLSQRDDFTNHNGGCLQFGPDGYLYVSLGDEGSQDDAGNNSQRIDKDFFSGILRIDVDKRTGNLEPNPNPNPAFYPNAASRPPDAVIRDGGIARFSIPINNPFVATAAGGSWDGQFNGSTVIPGHVRSEFWAVGLRNPWRMSFDADPADDNRVSLWVGDVGGGLREEVNLVTRGGNYGWAFREGFVNGPKSSQAPAGFDAQFGTRPLYDYRRTGTGGVNPALTGNSITGGVVYRGSRWQSLAGAYIFGDYVSGNIWTLRRDGTQPPVITRIVTEGGIAGFGIDPSNGDVLLADLNDNTIRRLVTGTPSNPGFPQTLGATGLFADLQDLSPSPGVLPYQINLPFWSDFAQKRRWFAIPDGTSRMTWAKEGAWTTPPGQIWVKHFDIETTRGDPATLRRLETRLLIRNQAGSYGVSYRWDETGLEAQLVPDEGVSFSIPIIENGTPSTQTWEIPSRGQCLICHNPQAGHALSTNTRQYNLESIIPGFPGNQVTVLGRGNFFTNTPPSENLLLRHPAPDSTGTPLEARVRSYLDVNCAYCHQAGGTAPSSFDLRSHLSLEATGLINKDAANNGGNPQNKLIVPGSPAQSIVPSRIAASNGFTRMPPIGNNLTDPEGLALINQWIAALPERQNYSSWRALHFTDPEAPESAPAADPDGDGLTNESEFLRGTLPLDGNDQNPPVLMMLPDGKARFEFVLPADRSAQVETSGDLFQWVPWDVPGNAGTPLLPGNHVLEAPASPGARFFRLKVMEN